MLSRLKENFVRRFDDPSEDADVLRGAMIGLIVITSLSCTFFIIDTIAKVLA